MSDICKETANIWSRLFDHRSFLSGEIQLTLQEFELKRGDTDVDNLFHIIESITDIKDTEVEKFIQVASHNLPKASEDLDEALNITRKFAELENKYKQEDLLEVNRQKRKADWENFMDYITSSYSEINTATEAKEEALKESYSELEKKLVATNRYVLKS